MPKKRAADSRPYRIYYYIFAMVGNGYYPFRNYPLFQAFDNESPLLNGNITVSIEVNG